MYRSIHIKYIILLSVMVFAGVKTHADVLDTDTIMSPYDMSELVITATRTPRSFKDTPVLTRLITRKDIEQADATDLRDLLQQELPSVEFTYSMNQKLNMNVGGFAGQSVLILVDGERLAGETMENVDFSRIDMNNVERIEIVRGAQSALYGAGALGGVINIITRGASEPWQLNLNARLADHREQRYGGVLGLKHGRVGNMLDMQYTSVDNYTVCMDYADDCEFRRVYGGTTFSVKDKLQYTPTDKLRLTARAGYFFKEMTT
ncbi:MAG: TonB-dependent receptor, partial [Bacteroidaceae bacterium]|nr:TonB-dependent receptor [Bacteroidaceae bacterium]